MPYTPEDRAVATALQMEIGHPPPFEEAELATLRRLFLHGAADLEALDRCPALESLDLFACAVDPASLGHVPGLASLRLAATRVGSLEPLAGMRDLEHLEVQFCDVRDLSPLRGHPRLRRGMLVGLPLDDVSWYEHRSALRAARTASGRPAVWLFSHAPDWALTRELWDQDLELCHALFDGRLPALVKPGVPRSMRIGVDYVIATADAVRDELSRRGGAGTDAFLKRVVRRVMGRSPRKPYNFRSSRTIGDATDAQDWIAASRVPDRVKASLASFVHRFPDVVFYRESPGMTGLDEHRHRARLPAWFVNYRTTVAGVAPEHPQREVSYRVTGLDGPLPGVDGHGELWISLGQHGLAHPDHRPVMDAGWFCVGIRTRGRPHALVAKLGDDAEERVFAYDPAAVEDGSLAAEPVPVFRSWGSLLDKVDAIEIGDRVVEARPG